MATITVAKGQKFLKRGDKLKALCIILQGSICQISKTDEWVMESGSMIGVMECATGNVSCDYVAREKTLLYTFPYRGQGDFKGIFEEQPKYAHVFVMAAVKQADVMLQHYYQIYKKTNAFYMFCSQMYQEYQEMCGKYEMKEKGFHKMECVEAFQPSGKVDLWKIDYYAGMSKASIQKIQQFYGEDHGMCIGEILNASSTLQAVGRRIDEVKEYIASNRGILLNEDKNDILNLYFELHCHCAMKNLPCDDLEENVLKISKCIKTSGFFDEELMQRRFEEYEEFDFENAAENAAAAAAADDLEEVDCLTKILTYAGFEEEKVEHARELLEQFKALPDMLSTGDSVRKLRRELTNIFFEAYEAVFKNSLEDQALSIIIKMFLNFGFLDVGMIGEENANNLFELTERLGQCNSDNVFTMYEWLKSIYRGENEPSKNEFDIDYTGYLVELRKTGKIDLKEQEKMKNDVWAKVEFEMQNMFRSTSRITYGKYSTYCPILADYDIINSVQKMLVTVERLDECINDIRNVDYSIFYREVVFSDPDHEINREFIQKEVLPQIILVPNVGTKAMMWQETAGTKRDTAARFIFPILTITSLSEMMIETAGRFRWEMCRKIQGMRWNDIRERSLTSEYCDYIQFYRKNHDLSTEAKEKLKNAITKAKNNYREVFVKDYQNWIKFEAKGSFRLNKVSRDIIFRYCPFAKEIRDTLGVNPMYREMFSKFEILKQRKMRHVDNVYNKYQQNGGSITPELQENLDYYQL